MRSPGSSPQDESIQPRHGAPAPREHEPPASLPPPAIIGLDIGQGPDLDRTWLPPAQELEPSANLPDRPPSTLTQRVPVLLAVAVGLILVAAAVILLWRGSTSGPEEPAIPPSGATHSSGGALATPSASPAASPRSTTLLATPASAQHRAAPSPSAVATPAPVTITIAVNPGSATVGNLTAEGAAQALRDALAALLPDQHVRLTSTPDQATITIGMSAPPNARPFLIAAAPLAVVTSPRLALTGVSREQAERLLRGEISNWFSAGAGLSLKVEPLALAAAGGTRGTPVATYDSYDALVAGLAEHPGGVALVPLSAVDWRVNVLAIDGIDPVSGQGDLSAYPFGTTLVAAIRADQAPALESAMAQAFAQLGWPLPASTLTRIGVLGDLSPASAARAGMLAPISGVVGAFDLAAISLGGHTPGASPTGTPVASNGLATELAQAGIDVVSLVAAGGDEEALDLPALLPALRDAGIAAGGAGATAAEARQPVIAERRGKRIAIIAAQVGSAPASPAGANGLVRNQVSPSALADDVRRAATQAEIVLVLLHRDEEGAIQPDSELIAAAHLAIDAGAAAVIVSNPAGIGGLETYRDRPIVYGIGALAGDPLVIDFRQGAIAELIFEGDRLVRLRLHGIETGPRQRPRLMSGGEQAAFLDRFWRRSAQFANSAR